MRLVHHFPHSHQPDSWPDNHQELTELVEDGDDAVLYVDYKDKHFRRPMAPMNPDTLRAEYSSNRSSVK
jgi:hypothetical protein